MNDDVLYDEEYHINVDMAMAAVKADVVGHWPTVAGYLHEEVERLQDENASLRRRILDFEQEAEHHIEIMNNQADRIAELAEPQHYSTSNIECPSCGFYLNKDHTCSNVEGYTPVIGKDGCDINRVPLID